MIRSLRRLLLALPCCFLAMILLIRTQPYDDVVLREFVLSPECSAPCVMGMRPGITPAEQAPEILQQHPWVAQIILQPNGILMWEWNGTQPDFLDDVQYVSFRDEVVDSIYISTRATLGQFRLLLGQPEGFAYGFERGRAVLVNDLYREPLLELRANAPCPLMLDTLLRTPGDLHYRPRLMYPVSDDPQHNELRAVFQEAGAWCQS